MDTKSQNCFITYTEYSENLFAKSVKKIMKLSLDLYEFILPEEYVLGQLPSNKHYFTSHYCAT